MGKYKICVYAICKNEEKFAERWVEAVKEADLIVVTDTGSTDGTVEKLRSLGVIVYEEKISPWRFDVARNVAMDHIPEDVDICVSNDMDEVFEPGWREKLENIWKPYHTRARYTFGWDYNEDGTLNKKFDMVKIHRRKEFRWVHPVHEILEFSGEDPDNIADARCIILRHYPDPDKSRTQYLPLLELSAKENPENSQIIFWLGREYMFRNENEKCINTLQQFLKLESAVWPEERSAAMRFIAKTYVKLGNKQEAKSWLYRAIAECNYTREPYLEMAEFAYAEQDWNSLYFFSVQGLNIKNKINSYLLEAKGWGSALDDFAAIAAYYLGNYNKSLEHSKKAIEMEPDNPRLQNNFSIIEKKVEELKNE